MTSKNMQMQKDTLVVLLQRCFEPMSTAALAELPKGFIEGDTRFPSLSSGTHAKKRRKEMRSQATEVSV